MTQKPLGAVLHLFFILQLQVPGVAVAIASGMRHPLDVLSVVFLLFKSVSTSTNALTYLLGQSPHEYRRQIGCGLSRSHGRDFYS